eukprot:jgi/Chrpa1/16439/Chrysochromulina_OHIO_Genome00005448-RA
MLGAQDGALSGGIARAMALSRSGRRRRRAVAASPGCPPGCPPGRPPERASQGPHARAHTAKQPAQVDVLRGGVVKRARLAIGKPFWMAFGEPPTRLRVDPHSEAQELTSLGLELTELLGRTLELRGELGHFVAARAQRGAQHGARWDRPEACTRHLTSEQPARVHLRLHLALEMDEALLGLGQRALRQRELVRALVEFVTGRTQLRIELGERDQLLGVRLLLKPLEVLERLLELRAQPRLGGPTTRRLPRLVLLERQLLLGPCELLRLPAEVLFQRRQPLRELVSLLGRTIHVALCLGDERGVGLHALLEAPGLTGQELNLAVRAREFRLDLVQVISRRPERLNRRVQLRLELPAMRDRLLELLLRRDAGTLLSEARQLGLVGTPTHGRVADREHRDVLPQLMSRSFPMRDFGCDSLALHLGHLRTACIRVERRQHFIGQCPRAVDDPLEEGRAHLMREAIRSRQRSSRGNQLRRSEVIKREAIERPSRGYREAIERLSRGYREAIESAVRTLFSVRAWRTSSAAAIPYACRSRPRRSRFPRPSSSPLT